MPDVTTVRDEAVEGNVADDVRFDKDDPILDAHIIPGANAVVTAEGLEAAGMAAGQEWLSIMGEPKKSQAEAFKEMLEDDPWNRVARAALEAAGIQVADEAYTRVLDTECEVNTVRCLGPGDKLYIKRKKED